MKGRRLLATSSLLLGLLVPSSAAEAAQTDASEPPTVRGPLRQELKRCRANRVRFEGRIVGRVRSCIRLYTLRPAAETDAARDYGAIWLQTTVAPRGRWCAKVVRSDIDVPEGTKMHAHAPPTRFVDHRVRVRTRLVVDARDQATTPGTIRQGYALIPRALRTYRQDNGGTWRAAWRGSTRSKVATASGIEISWEAGAPPDRVTSDLSYSLRRQESC
jgi:hypothetical protein